MIVSSPLVHDFYSARMSEQLDCMTGQMDDLAELCRLHLDCDLTVFLHRRQETDRLAPASCKLSDRCRPTDMNLLERLWTSPDAVDAAGDGQVLRLRTDGSVGPLSDAFAAVNGFTHRLVYPYAEHGRVIAAVVCYWFDQPRRTESAASFLELIASTLSGTVSFVLRLRQVNDFSLRLGEQLAMLDWPAGNLRFSEVVAKIVDQARLVVPVCGLCLLAQRGDGNRLGAIRFFDREPSHTGFADRLVDAVRTEFTDHSAESETIRDLSHCFRKECSAVVALPLDPEPNRRFVLAAWTRLEGGFAETDRELLAVYCRHAEAVLKIALAVRGLRKSKRRLEKSSARLADAEALAALADMTSGIAHDFNNIIGGIVGRVQLMKLKNPEGEVRKGLDKVENLALEGAQTLRRVQEFASHARYKDLKPLVLAELIEACLARPDALWRHEAEQKNIRILTDLEDDAAVVDGCGESLTTSLDELLRNAVEHSPLETAVRVSLHGEDSKLVLAVTDQGPGIAAEHRNKVFYPFYTTKHARGAGLGLAIVHGVAVRHGGLVRLESLPGAGTTVCIELERSSRPDEDSEITHRSTSQHGLRILVVDDDAQIREVLGDMLTIDGHTVVACADGYAAVDALKQDRFDLVITDLGMPGMSGLELAGRIRHDYPETPVAMITGWGTQLNEQEIVDKGVRSVLPKPFHLKDVKAMVRELSSAS